MTMPKEHEFASQVAYARALEEYCEKQSAELEAARAEIEHLKTVPMKYRRMAFNAQLQDENAKLNQQLAAEQTKIVELREALENHSGNYKLSKEECTKINALLDAPSDTSALEAIVKKAGEVMRENCIIELNRLDYWYSARAIRTLPAVTMEDLK